jgi:hypothetical protein
MSPRASSSSTTAGGGSPASDLGELRAKHHAQAQRVGGVHARRIGVADRVRDQERRLRPVGEIDPELPRGHAEPARRRDMRRVLGDEHRGRQLGGQLEPRQRLAEHRRIRLGRADLGRQRHVARRGLEELRQAIRGHPRRVVRHQTFDLGGLGRPGRLGHRGIRDQRERQRPARGDVQGGERGERLGDVLDHVVAAHQRVAEVEQQRGERHGVAGCPSGAL